MTDSTTDSTALSLVPPAAVATVTDDQAAAQAQQIDPAVKSQIDATVTQYVNSLLSADPHSPAFDQKLDAVHNSLLQRPTAALSSGVFYSKSQIANSLVTLRRTVQDLAPTQQGLFGK